MCTSQSDAPVRSTRPTGSRLKLWQLEPRLHCSVIGTCLTLDDLRRACARAGLQTHTPLADHELHHAFVAMADQPSPAIRQLQKTLERRHRDSVALVQRSDPDQWPQLWQQALAEGRVSGLYWGLLSRADLPARLQARITGEVHMLSHLSGASQQAELKRIPALERRVALLQRKLEQHRQDHQRRQQDNAQKLQRLQLRLREAQRAERQLHEAQARLEALEHNDLVKRLRAQVECYAAQLSAARLAKERADSELDTARRQRSFEREAHCRTRALLHQVVRERQALERFVESELLEPSCPAGCAAAESGCDMDLCGRCILYVGGRQQVTSHLAQLVQRCNGRLICHDGGLEESPTRLDALLPKADAVVCPLDCVSHDAMRRVKRFCKQYAKRLVLLPTASVSAFTRGLQELGAVSG